MLCIKRVLPRLGELSLRVRVESKSPAQRLPPFLAMTLSALYPPPAELAKHAHINCREQYDKMYKQSLEDPDTFWSEQAEAFHWTKRWHSPVLKYVRSTARHRQTVLNHLVHARLLVVMA